MVVIFGISSVNDQRLMVTFSAGLLVPLLVLLLDALEELLPEPLALFGVLELPPEHAERTEPIRITAVASGKIRFIFFFASHISFVNANIILGVYGYINKVTAFGDSSTFFGL
ncbi:hypothetical protein ACFFK0_10955 [Paenibacillus chartarius]|uniref:Uncharacterized protein n=1 Tax=Paenibacillus chartarius TaxID=747481 RepID=A0ABV6DJX9_9BACL